MTRRIRAVVGAHALRPCCAAGLERAGSRAWMPDRRAIGSMIPRRRSRDPLAITVAPALIERRFRKLRKAYRRLTDGASMRDCHAIRRQVKKLRYAVESFDAIYGKPAEPFERRLRRLQDDLGRHQDACVLERVLLSLASDPPRGCPPRTLFLMGRFAQQCCADREQARARIDKRWRQIRGRWKTLRSSLEDLRDRSSPTDTTKGDGAALPASAAVGVNAQSLSTPSPAHSPPGPHLASPYADHA